MLRLIFGLLVFACTLQLVQADTWRVCYKGSLCDPSLCDFMSIQTAIDNAVSGDIIEVYEGNYDGASYCGTVSSPLPAKALTIRGVCQTCPSEAKGRRMLARTMKKKNMRAPPTKKSMSKLPSKPKKTKTPTKDINNGAETCDIFISKNGYNVNNASGESYGFLTGLTLCEEASGSTVENLKFLCAADIPSTPPLELGIGIYLLNTKSVTIQNNEFVDCLKGVVLDGAQYSLVTENEFEAKAVNHLTKGNSYVGAYEGQLWASRYQSCNMVLLLERVDADPSLIATQTIFNVIEKNKGSLMPDVGAGCVAFELSTATPSFPDGITGQLRVIQYNWIRRNQVVGIGAPVGPLSVFPQMSITVNDSLVGIYTFGSVQNNFFEKNQFASLTYDVYFDTTNQYIGNFTMNVADVNIAQTVRQNRFLQTQGSASIVLGDTLHRVVENEIQVTQTSGVGIWVEEGNDEIIGNRINVPQVSGACDVRISGSTLTSIVIDSGIVC